MAWELIHDVTGFRPNARERATPDGRSPLLFRPPQSCYPVRDHRRRVPCQDRRTAGKRRPLGMSRSSTLEARRRARDSKRHPLSSRLGKRAMNRRMIVLGLVSFGLAWPSSSYAQVPASPSLPWGAWTEIPTVVVLSAGDNSRVSVVDEAVDFWNAEFSQLGSAFRLGATVHKTLSDGDLQVLGATPSTATPSLLNGVGEANGDVIIVLSDEAGFNPFAFPLRALRKVLVVIPSLRKAPLTLPGLARNVVAHELGHAVGLGHTDDAKSLMCGGGAKCPPKVGDSFFPLAPLEKTKLLEMYPRNWQPGPSRPWRADPPVGIAG
jgi:Matrixin